MIGLPIQNEILPLRLTVGLWPLKPLIWVRILEGQPFCLIDHWFEQPDLDKYLTMEGFAIIIGSCKIVPASPKLALLLVMWMFGTVPNQSYEDYKQAYLDSGASQEEVVHIEQCFLDWPGKADKAQ